MHSLVDSSARYSEEFGDRFLRFFGYSCTEKQVSFLWGIFGGDCTRLGEIMRKSEPSRKKTLLITRIKALGSERAHAGPLWWVCENSGRKQHNLRRGMHREPTHKKLNSLFIQNVKNSKWPSGRYQRPHHATGLRFVRVYVLGGCMYLHTHHYVGNSSMGDHKPNSLSLLRSTYFLPFTHSSARYTRSRQASTYNFNHNTVFAR